MASQNQQPPSNAPSSPSLAATATANLNTTHTIPLQNLASSAGSAQPGAASAIHSSAAPASIASLSQNSSAQTTSRPKTQLSRTRDYVQTLPNWRTLSPHEPRLIEDLLHDLLTFDNVLVPANDTLVSLVIATSANDPEDLLAMDPGPQFANFLNVFGDSLKQARESAVCVCCILPISGRDAGVKLSIQSRMFKLPSRIRRMYETPRLAIILAIAEHWVLPKQMIATLLSEQPNNNLLVPMFKFKTRPKPSHSPSLNRPAWKVYELDWCHVVPRWKSGFYMYIWELHQTVPVIERATILVNQTSQDKWQILILRTSTSTPSISGPNGFLAQARNMFGVHQGQHSPTDEVARILLSLIETVCIELRTFRDICVRRVSLLRMQGRRRPSRHKINFLSHLDDFRQQAHRGLGGLELLLADITELSLINSSVIPVSSPNTLHALPGGNPSSRPPLRSLTGCCNDLKEELDMLSYDLEELGRVILEAREMVKQQVELRQISLSMILTLLASIFLPFSLVAGLFGMNVRDPLWPSKNQNPNEVEKVAVNAKTTISSAQSTMVSSTDLAKAFEDALSAQPSNFLWSFKQFWYIAVAVTAGTIFLPIIAGPTFRAIVKFSDKHKELWRFAVFICVVAGIMTSSFLEAWVASITLGGVQGLIAAVGSIRSHLRNARFLRWTAYCTILVACLLYDFLAEASIDDDEISFIEPTGPALTGILPPIWLFVLWMRAGRDIIDIRRLETVLVRRGPHPIALLHLLTPLETIQNIPTRKRRIAKVGIFVVATALNCVCSMFIPWLFYLGLSFTPVGLYALHRLIWAIRDRENRVFWSSFLAITALSDFWWWMDDYFATYLGVSVLIPGLSLWAFYGKETLQRAWTAARLRLREPLNRVFDSRV